MLELFPEGFEEVDRPQGVELAAYTDAGGEERLWHVLRRRAQRRRRGGLGGPLARVPPAGPRRLALDRAAVGDAARRRARGRRSIPGAPSAPASHPTTQLCLEFAAGARRPVRSSTSAAAPACSRSRRRCSASARCSRSTSRRRRSRRPARTPRVNGVDVRGAPRRCPTPGSRRRTSRSRTSRSRRWKRSPNALDVARLVTSGYLASEQPRLAGLRARRASHAAAAGRRDLYERDVSAYDSRRGDVPRRLPRLQGLARRRARGARALLRDGHAENRPPAPTSR